MGIKTTVKGPSQSLPGRYVTGGNGALALRIDRNLVPGLYSAEVPKDLKKAVKPLVNAAGHILFGVMVSGEESRLNPLSQEDTTMIATYLRFLEASSADDVLRAMRGEAFGREIWRPLAIGALLLLLLEVVLTRWIAIQRRQGEKIEVTFEDANLPSSGFRDQLDAMESKKQ